MWGEGRVAFIWCLLLLPLKIDSSEGKTLIKTAALGALAVNRLSVNAWK